MSLPNFYQCHLLPLQSMLLDKVKIPCYVLGLVKQQERTRTTIQRLVEGGHRDIYPRYGVNARDNPIHLLPLQKKWKAIPSNYFKPAEQGCAFAHLEALDEFLKSEEQLCLIVEDDLLLPNNWESLFKRVLVSAPSEADLIFLGWYRIGEKPNLPLDQAFIEYYPCCTHCYLVTRRGASKICKAIKKKGIYSPIDLWYAFQSRQGNITCFCANPNFFLSSDQQIIPYAREDRADGIAHQDLRVDSMIEPDRKGL